MRKLVLSFCLGIRTNIKTEGSSLEQVLCRGCMYLALEEFFVLV